MQQDKYLNGSNRILLFLLLTAFVPVPFANAAERHTNPGQSIADLILSDGEDATSAVIDLAEYPIDNLCEWITGFNRYPKPKVRGELIKGSHVINDSLSAPYFIYIPSRYDPTISTPLILWLHGGVSRPEFSSDDTREYFVKHPVVELCETEGWLTLLPLARHDCLWWNMTGMDHLHWLVREVKRGYNVDDNRVVMCGFSDGGSGAYHLAMLEPTDYALFFPWSGKISVGTIVGGIQVYPANLTARPLFPVNGGKDGLYPAEKLLPMMKFLMEYVGPELSYIAYDTAGHNPGYLSKELPLFTARVKAMPRRPLRSRLTWECSDPEFGRLDWINITAIDTSSEGDDWRQDLNFPQVDDRIMIGFMSDREYEGEGVRIASVVDDTTSIAHQMGLMDGDIVVALDEIPVKNIGDLGAAKRTKERGDQVTITVIRGDDNLTLSGVFPPPREYDAFPHKTPSASIEAYCIGNHFYVTTYRVKDFSLYIHPEMVRLDQPVVVTVDGKILFDALIKPDSRLLLDEFLKDRDRKLLWAGRIDVKL